MIGSEYAHLAIKPKKTIPPESGDKKIQKIWNKKSGKFIDYASYQAINKQFFEAIKKNTSIEEDFEAFKSTEWTERIMLRAFQFSSAKDLTESMALQTLALQSNGFTDFKEKASEIVEINRSQWLRVEQDNLIRNAVMGEGWRKIEESKSLYPYWQYKTEEDDRVRPEHESLDNLVFRIGDPEGDDCYPPNDWNCRCHADVIDDTDLNEQGLKVSDGKDYLNEKDADGEPYIADNFKYNSGKDGPLPNTGSYFDVLPNINKLDSESFDFE